MPLSAVLRCFIASVFGLRDGVLAPRLEALHWGGTGCCSGLHIATFKALVPCLVPCF